MPDTRPLSVRCAERAALALGFTFENLDRFAHHLARISGDFGAVFVGAGAVSAYPINNAAAAAVARDKAHSYAVMAQAGVPFPPAEHVFVSDRYADVRPPGRGLDDAAGFAEAFGYPVFVKPNDGSHGRFARSVPDRHVLERHLRAIAEFHPIALIQQRICGRERRIFCLDGAPVFAYVKTRPRLITDGVRRVKDQLAAVSQARHRQGLPPIATDDPALCADLARLGLDLCDTPPAGLAITVAEATNSALGGGHDALTTVVSPADQALSARLAQAFGLRVFAIDLIEAADGTSFVLEINANPALATLERAGRQDLLDQIWRDVLVKAAEACRERRL